MYFVSRNIIFNLKGSQSVQIELNNNYIEPGVIAKFYKYNLNKYVNTKSNLDASKTGTYYVRYNLRFLGHSLYLEREINVIDKITPYINLNGDSTVMLYVGDEYNELGATAEDNYDGNLTNLIRIVGKVDTSKDGTYEIKYIVEDSSGNENTVIRTVIVKNYKEPVQEINTVVSSKTETNYNDSIVKYIIDQNYDVSIGYYNLSNGKEYLYRENQIYFGASLIKTLDAIYLYDNNLVNNEIKSYIKEAISVSNNEAHYYLLSYIGRDNLKKYGNNLGAYNTLASSDYYNGNTTVLDQLIYWKKLYSMIKNNEELKSFFVNDYGNCIQINNLVTMHKYGYYGDYFHDVGIVFDTEPYIIVILTKHGNSDFHKIINDLSELMYKYHKGQL